MKIVEDSIEINGQKLSLQVGKLAQASDMAVYARIGDTCILVTVNVGRENPDMDYLPLQVEYVEKLYAGGKIKGSRWVKREGKPSDEAVLRARIIDRAMRPLFPQNFRRAIQVIITLLSVDGVNSPEILSAIAASAAVHFSSAPWNGPLSTIRVGHVKDNFIVNPTEDDQKFSTMDLLVSSGEKKVIMIETSGEELSEQTVIDGIAHAKKENARIIEFIKAMGKKVGKKKIEVTTPLVDEKLTAIIKKDFKKNIDELIKSQAEKEFEDKTIIDNFVEEVAEKYKEEFEKKAIAKAIDYVKKQTIKENVLKTKKRVDGRPFDKVRDIYCETSILPRTHGSAIFQRGDTQVLSIVTLGSPDMAQLIEGPESEEVKHYIHHYHMPPYSVGETGRMGFPSRREIGHGALAEKAIEPMLPTEKEFPYTIRVVSEVLSSNGSTSQASTCGSTLALMDAGVPIKSPVAGIAMGLYSKSDTDYAILTDIMGLEDFTGEMDFKVAGTEKGITAIQLDVKNEGLTDKMIEESLAGAKVARLFILAAMNKAISAPRKELSKFAPKVIVITPPQDKIGEIIGPGGKNIRSLIAKTQTEINVSDDGTVSITGLDKEKVEEAARLIESITREVMAGEEFEGEVKRILPFGAFIEVLPGKEGMVHVSKMGKGFVKDPSDVVKIGQKVKVKVNEIDRQGRINLELIS